MTGPSDDRGLSERLNTCRLTVPQTRGQGSASGSAVFACEPLSELLRGTWGALEEELPSALGGGRAQVEWNGREYIQRDTHLEPVSRQRTLDWIT